MLGLIRTTERKLIVMIFLSILLLLVVQLVLGGINFGDNFNQNEFALFYLFIPGLFVLSYGFFSGTRKVRRHAALYRFIGALLSWNFLIVGYILIFLAYISASAGISNLLFISNASQFFLNFILQIFFSISLILVAAIPIVIAILTALQFFVNS